MGKRKRQVDVWNRGKAYTSKSDHIALEGIFGRLTTIDGIVHIESSHNARLGKKHSKRRLLPLVDKRLSDIQHIQQAREAYLAHNQIDINRHKNQPSKNAIPDSIKTNLGVIRSQYVSPHDGCLKQTFHHPDKHRTLTTK